MQCSKHTLIMYYIPSFVIYVHFIIIFLLGESQACDLVFRRPCGTWEHQVLSLALITVFFYSLWFTKLLITKLWVFNVQLQIHYQGQSDSTLNTIICTYRLSHIRLTWVQSLATCLLPESTRSELCGAHCFSSSVEGQQYKFKYSENVWVKQKFQITDFMFWIRYSEKILLSKFIYNSYHKCSFIPTGKTNI